jgi:hypothetical protein
MRFTALLRLGGLGQRARRIGGFMPENWNRYAHIRIHRAAALKLSVTALIAGFLTCVSAGGALAATSYGPLPPPVTVPGGYTAVVTSVTVGPAGGTIGPVPCDGGLITVTVPAGAFASSVQITITCPNLAGIAPMRHFRDDMGGGIDVTQGGSPFPGTFLKPLTATFGRPDITPASVALVWNGTAFVVDPDSTTVAGASSVGFDSDPDFVIESPVSVSVVTVPHATVPVTGEPFLGEGILAGVLVLGGTGGVFLSRRRRARV